MEDSNMEVFKVLGYIALGMAVSEFYNLAMWRKYREGLQQSKVQNAPRYARYGGGAPK